MFSIYNGAELKQWSTGNMLTNPHMNDGDKVRFVSASGMVETNIAYMDGDTVVVDVPNRILTMDNSVYVELMGDHKCGANFSVVKQPKPDGYVLVDNKKTMPSVQPVTHWVDVATIEMSKTFKGGSGAMPVPDFPLYKAGETVTFKIDGVEHSLVAYDAAGDTVIGDRGWIGDPEVYHWTISIYSGGDMVFFYTENPCTLSWNAKKETAHRLDEKFMPLLTDANGVRYKLTVSTSGALSAVKVDE